MGRPFHADELQAAATRRTGLSDFGDLAFQADLDALLDALNHDAQLHAAGRLALRRIVTDHLVNRLLLTRQRQRVPGIFTQPLAAPLIVTGLPRSGTTLLHRMLAADPAHHGPPYWELAQPVAHSMAQPGWPDHRRWYAALTLGLRGLLEHDLDRKHFVAVDSPEEDLHTLGATFQSWYYWMAAPVYGYLDWYLGQDQQRKYREYRAWLQVLQAAHPGRRLSSELRRNLAARDQHPAVVLDLRYDDLVTDPGATAQRIYQRFGLNWTDAAARALRRYVRQNPPGRHGAHHYPPDAGLPAAEVSAALHPYQQSWPPGPALFTQPS